MFIYRLLYFNTSKKLLAEYTRSTSSSLFLVRIKTNPTFTMYILFVKLHNFICHSCICRFEDTTESLGFSLFWDSYFLYVKIWVLFNLKLWAFVQLKSNFSLSDHVFGWQHKFEESNFDGIIFYSRYFLWEVWT